MLRVENLKVNYGGIEAVKDVSFVVPEKSIVTLIGANGAGKSTTLRCISGLKKQTSGKIIFEGEDIARLDTTQRMKKGIVLVPEGRHIFPDMTVLENIKIGAYLRKDDLSADIERVYKLFPRLKERHWQYAGTLSGGEQQMLALARALMSHPKLIMMDEPSLGLAPLVVKGIFDIIREINRALRAADRAYVLETGKVTMQGTGEELLADESIKAAYLGKNSSKKFVN